MRNLKLSLFLAGFLIVYCGEIYLYPQAPTAANPATEPEQPHSVRLEYAKPLRSNILTPGMSIGTPMHCAEDGSAFFPVYSITSQSPPQVDFLVYGIHLDGDTVISVPFNPDAAPGLRRIQPGASGNIAVSDSRVAVLVEAITAEEQIKDPKTRNFRPFLLTFDRKGNFLHASAIELPFHIAEIGFLNDRELLVIGSVAADWRQHWAVIDEDGKLLRNLQPGHDDTEYSKDNSLETRLKTVNGGGGRAQLIPYRGRLLMLETNSDSPIYELNGGGVVKSTKLKLPSGEKIWQIIPSSGRNWDVIFGHPGQGSVENGLPPGLFRPEGIGEFDPETGELLRLVIPGAKHYPASLACERNGVFTELSADPKDGSLLVEEATVR